MGKAYTARLVSTQIAPILSIEHDDFIQAVARLAQRGVISRNRIRIRGGLPLDATLDLTDIMILLLDSGATLEHAVAVRDLWLAEAGDIRRGMSGEFSSNPDQYLSSLLPRTFGASDEFKSALQTCVAERTDPRVSGREFGFRINDDVIVVAAKHPFVRGLLAPGVTSADINKAITRLPLSDRRQYKFGGVVYRTAECSLEAFLSAINDPYSQTV